MRGHRWAAAVVAAATAITWAVAGSGSGAAAAQSACPTTVDGSTFAAAEELRTLTKEMADLGSRPTASPAQLAYIESIEARLRSMKGVTLSAIPEEIDLQLDDSAALSIGTEPLPVAGAVPYARPTGDGGVQGRLVHVPAGTPISSVDVAGAIVVRPAATAGVQFAIFGAVAYYLHDPDRTIDPAAMYERDNFGYLQRVADLRAAASAGAAGLVLVHGFPTPTVAGQYAPYEGERWNLPAVYVGADEGKRLVEAAGSGASAALRTTAERRMAPTRSVIATLPGQSNERIVVQSHTDGMNAIWDNGPAAMLAMASWFSKLPLSCRPRTLQFVFTTAHLHLSQSGAYCFASVLDEEYESGTVALVVAIEHLGAREFAAVPRADGGPGRRLVATGQSEVFVTFAMESPVLVEALIERVVARDLRRSFVLRGADAPRVGFPPHRSFGGEGGPYREHLVPTVAGITGPWTLYNPSFTSIDDLLDLELMRRQTMAFGDVVLRAGPIPRQVLAGADNVYRPGRDLFGSDPGGGVPPSGRGCGGGGRPGAAGSGGFSDGHAGHDHGASAPATLPRTGGPVTAGPALALWALAALAAGRALLRRISNNGGPAGRF